MRRLPVTGFVASVAVLAYAAGFMTSLRDWWPAQPILTAIDTAGSLAEHWRNDLGLEPTRFLVASPTSPPARVQVNDAARMMPGLRFVAGLTPGRAGPVGASLFDAAGNELFYWPIRYQALAPHGEPPTNVSVHGIEPLPDGSIIVSFDNGDALARIAACGTVLWSTAGKFHHAFGRSDRNSLWIWEYREVSPAMARQNRKRPEPRREYLVEVDIDTGRRLRQVSLEQEIVGAEPLVGRFALHAEEDANALAYCCDHFHPNDAKPLPAALAPAFPMFRAGDILISLRSLNMVAVLDHRTMRVKWSQIGPWHRQHDPDFRPDGTISVLNNNMGLGTSQVIVVDPASGDARIAYDGRQGDFYTWRRGRHQALANGNIVLAETERGRAIEVAPNGDIVWAYNNVYDQGRNGLVNEALVLPVDYFAPGALDCRTA